MKNNKKSFTNAVLVGVIILLIAIGGYFVWSKKPSQSNQQQVSPTSDWKTYMDTVNGFSFKYPENFPTTYIHVVNTPGVATWPPSVKLTTGSLSCKSTGSSASLNSSTVQKTIGSSIYCVTDTPGAAAGTLYHDYSYETSYNNKLITFSFTLGDVDCGNYSDPQMTQCNQERASFNLDSLVNQIFSTFKFTQPTTTGDTEPVPVIYSISPLRGPVGTKITIKGKNLNGFEGDLNARIATEFNSADYSSGIMYGERNGSSDTIVTTIQSSFCKQDNSYSGLPCKSYFYVTPGVYEISVKPYTKESNSVSFTVTE